jgi:hypothetical protein
MGRNIFGKNIIINENINKDEFIYIEEVPMRIPFTILDTLFELNLIKENDNFTDISSSSGDLLLYCKINFKINIANHINSYNDTYMKNINLLNRYNINIINSEPLNFVYNWDNSDVFWLWIEEPNTEIEILKLIQNAVVNHGHRKCKVLIAYETMQNICTDIYKKNFFLNKTINCKNCENIRENINKNWDDNKIENIDKLLRQHNVKYNNRIVDCKHIYFNISNKCRHSGIFSIITIHFN